MAHNPAQRGPQDSAKINLREEHELIWWTQKLGVSHEQLRRAVSEVGPVAEKVAKFLNRSAYM
jgi:hypothetical protein